MILDNIKHPRNAFHVQTDAHDMFGELKWGIEATPTDGRVNSFMVRLFEFWILNWNRPNTYITRWLLHVVQQYVDAMGIRYPSMEERLVIWSMVLTLNSATYNSRLPEHCMLAVLLTSLLKFMPRQWWRFCYAAYLFLGTQCFWWGSLPQAWWSAHFAHWIECDC